METSLVCAYRETVESLPVAKLKTKGVSWLIRTMLLLAKVIVMQVQNLRTMQTIKLKLACIGIGTKMKSIKKMHEKQIENLLKQSPDQRYVYFVRFCADFEQVWGLVVDEDNWVIFKDADGDEIFPLWSHPDLAEACCFEEHKQMGAKPQVIGLESFINNCIPDMVSDGVRFGIFYDKSREGLVIEGNALKEALEEEVGSVWE